MAKVRMEIELEPCRYCGSTEEPRIVLTVTRSPHYAAVFCRACQRHLRWLGKPDRERIRRPAAHRDLARRYSRGWCELCLTRETDLPAGQTLEGHHVVEYQDGGSDARENVWVVCSACARLIHWRRSWCRGEGVNKEEDVPKFTLLEAANQALVWLNNLAHTVGIGTVIAAAPDGFFQTDLTSAIDAAERCSFPEAENAVLYVKQDCGCLRPATPNEKGRGGERVKEV